MNQVSLNYSLYVFAIGLNRSAHFERIHMLLFFNSAAQKFSKNCYYVECGVVHYFSTNNKAKVTFRLSWKSGLPDVIFSNQNRNLGIKFWRALD
jgi:hypothetical protein